MSIVPDLLSHEAFEKVVFSVLGALISGFSGVDQETQGKARR